MEGKDRKTHTKHLFMTRFTLIAIHRDLLWLLVVEIVKWTLQNKFLCIFEQQKVRFMLIFAANFEKTQKKRICKSLKINQ